MFKVKEIESDEDEIVDEEDLEDKEDAGKPAKRKAGKPAASTDGDVIVQFTTKTGTFSRTFSADDFPSDNYDTATEAADAFIATHTGNGFAAEIVDESEFPTQGDHQARQHAEMLRKKAKIA